MNAEEDINHSKEKLRGNIEDAANEALGTHTVTINNKKRNSTPWFCLYKCREKGELI